MYPRTRVPWLLAQLLGASKLVKVSVKLGADSLISLPISVNGLETFKTVFELLKRSTTTSRGRTLQAGQVRAE
jgi:hypothetical protein